MDLFGRRRRPGKVGYERHLGNPVVRPCRSLAHIALSQHGEISGRSFGEPLPGDLHVPLAGTTSVTKAFTPGLHAESSSAARRLALAMSISAGMETTAVGTASATR